MAADAMHASCGAIRADRVSEADLGRLSDFEFRFEWLHGAYAEDFRVVVAELDGEAPCLTIDKRRDAQGPVLHAEYSFAAEDVQRLRDAIARFDLVAWAGLPTRGSYTEQKHYTVRFRIGDAWYFMNDMTRYPETQPPVKDRAFACLYGIFNAYVSADPAMEAVWTDGLPDPAELPLWSDRVVVFRGREVHLVPGTGPGENAYDAVIAWDLDVPWWVDEGYVGRWTTMPCDVDANAGLASEQAELAIRADGSIVLTVDGEAHEGHLSGTRCYRPDAGGVIDDCDFGSFSLSYLLYEDGRTWGLSVQDARTSDHLALRIEGLPAPHQKAPRTLAFTRME